jgi:hypothetical protein
MEIELNMTSSPGKDGSNWPAFPFWILGGILMYVLSSGPYMMAEQKGLAAAPVLQTIYEPLFYAYFHTPFHKPLGMYFHLWRHQVFDKNGDMIVWD